jgi:serine/threonine protein kinase/tetratricopeptide (TPR) repeat protein
MDLSSARPDHLERVRAGLRDRYTVERELGQGGMATVYLADDPRHQRQVAIKVLRPELAAVLGADRFTREIRIAAALNHPHILPLHDSGEANGLLFYVMPYVRGGSLRQKLSREGRLAADTAVSLIRQVALALDHAHAHGLIHRDIKPENILLHEGEAVVTDFGIALAGGTDPAQRLTVTGLMVGTPEYMSPEQAAGERMLDARSDVYSLGCVLYELLAGEPPFAGASARVVISRRFTEPAPSIRRLRPEVSPAVGQAITRALAPDPQDRFPSALAFADALVGSAIARAPRRPSIAVLPFISMSADPENEFFADGITEDVIAHLSKVGSLKVIGRGSVMPFKKRERSLREIGIALDVGTLLDGSVRRAGSRVRIVAQLIDAESDRHLWTETYDRELTDIFAIQTDVALQIAAALKAELSPEETRRLRQEPTSDLQAYQRYLLGRHCLRRWTQEGVEQAIRHFEQAVERDPEYALAHAAIAYAYTDLGLGIAGPMPSEEAFKKARAAALRALQIDAGLAEAHGIMAHLKFVCDYDWAGAEQEFKRALELDPNSGDTCDFYGLMLSALERYDEAIVMQRRAHELDPLAHRMDLATTMLRAGRYEEAMRVLTRVLEIDPHFPMGHATMGWALYLRGMPERAVASLEQAVVLSPGSTAWQAQLGQAYAMVGRADDAKRILDQLLRLSTERYVSPYHIAYIYTGLGDQEQAMDWLERACETRAGGIFGVKGSFLFASLRDHPRFKALLARMNLA